MEKAKLEKTRDRWAAARVLDQCVKEVSRIFKSVKWDKDERPLEDSRSVYALDLDPDGGDGLPRHVLSQSHGLEDGWAEEEQAHVQSKPHRYMSPLKDSSPANRPLFAENGRKKGKCEGMESQGLFAANLENMTLRREVSLEHPENQTAWVVASGSGGREEGVSTEVEDRCYLVRSTKAPLFQMAGNRVGILGGTGDDVSCQGQAVENEKVQVVGRE